MPLGDPGHRRRRFGAASIVVALLLSAAACTGDDEDGGAPRGEVIGDGDTYEATIRRTDGNVPHVTGDSLADVAFGQGFASGEDRTCDLADQVIKVRGERARWFGRGEDDVHLDSDIAWRTIGIFERASDDWRDVSPDVEELFTAFTDGWNAHLDAVGVDDLSGWCAGEDWVRPIEPVEVYAYARSITLQASGGALAPYIPSARPPGAPPDTVTDNEPEPAATADDSAQDTTTTGGDTGGSDNTGNTGSEETTQSTEATGRASAGDVTDSAAATGTPGATGTPDATADDATAGESAAVLTPILPTERIASNAWAIGADRSAEGGGMLLANPHFPWEGELRFWEVHLTVPGVLDVYGAQLSGLPGVGIGFSQDVAWTHTVSAGNRFTAYRLALAPGDPTSYRYGDEVREMTSTDVTVAVLDDDGSIDEVRRTMWSTHYGPVIDFPGVGWTDTAALTYRDANIDNDEIADQYLGMLRAGDLDELIEVHEQVGGVPLFNTIAASSDGRAWYADTSATPNLSDEALRRYRDMLASDPLVGVAAENGAVLLDGSDPLFEWAEVDGARDPGLVPFADMPQMERDDYVFNANDSFWLPHAQATIEGEQYSPLHGDQRTARSPRTRENATLLSSTDPAGPAGDDGKFTLDELADASVANHGYTSRALLDAVVARCTGTPAVRVPALLDDDGNAVLPAGEVSVDAACAALEGWDGVYDIDRAGPAVWRETMHQFTSAELNEQGRLWAEPFDPARPVATPAGLTPAPAEAPDPVLEALARAVQVLDAAGIAVDAPLGDVQFALRDGETIPIHGGDSSDGTTNVVGYGSGSSILDPAISAIEGERVAPTAAVSRYRVGAEAAGRSGETSDLTGYLINNGTSFLLAVDLAPDGPRARAFLTYGNTEDRSSDDYTDATRRFSAKEWRDVAFTEDEVAAATTRTLTVRG